MEFLDGSWKKEVSSWDALMGEELLNQEAILEGAIHSIRNMGDVAFVIIRRREGLFQTVFVNEDVDFSIHDLKEGMTVRVKGVVNKEERAPHGRELHIREIQVLSSPAEPLPLAIDKWKLNTSLEAKLNYRSLSLRNIQERARFKIQEALTRAFRDYLYKNGFTEIHTPKIGARGAEGGANLFKLSYFHKPAVLAQSPQFYKQMMVGVFDRVFETGPVFRCTGVHSIRKCIPRFKRITAPKIKTASKNTAAPSGWFFHSRRLPQNDKISVVSPAITPAKNAGHPSFAHSISFTAPIITISVTPYFTAAVSGINRVIPMYIKASSTTPFTCSK